MTHQIHITQMKICFKLYFENAAALFQVSWAHCAKHCCFFSAIFDFSSDIKNGVFANNFKTARASSLKFGEKLGMIKADSFIKNFCW